MDWTCPRCGEKIEAPGPASLALVVDGHNIHMHPDEAIPLSSQQTFEWTCPLCNEVIRRSSAENLKLATSGHTLFRHKKPVPAESCYSWNKETNRVDSLTPIDHKDPAGFVAPFEMLTVYDYKFLAGVLVKW